MCGIAGFSGRYGPGLLEAMNRAQAHRGPDGEGIWHDPAMEVGLAHRRLAIIDLSERGLQPMHDAAGSLTITYNGEIYNYRELRGELERQGFGFRSDSDTEVILNLYRRDGLAALPRLNGIFAFALWDAAARTLLLARDPAGVKPLYYARTPTGLVFASELKALLRVPDVDRSLDLEALTHYLGFLYAPSPGTMLRAVRKLSPGHLLLIKPGGAPAIRSYARNPYEQAPLHRPLEDAVAQTQELVRRAVQRQMVADVPVGAFLSGGLDSSAVVAFAREFAQGGRLPCFTIANRSGDTADEGWADDLPYARRVAAHLGVELNVVEVGPEMAERFAWMVGQLDEPQADPAALNAFFIAELARSNGIKVLLSGAGGDDIFTGYRRHLAVQIERHWAWLPVSVRRLMAGASRCLPQAHPWFRRLAKAFQFADQNEERRLAGHFLWLHPQRIQAVLSPETRRVLGDFDVLRPMLDALRRLPPGTPRLNRMLHLDGTFFLTDHNLNYTDKMSMAAGVETRVPFLDPDLVAFAAGLPTDYKQRGPVGKWILKKAMEPWLPHEVIHRPKTGFGVPLRRWMQHELRPLLDDTLSAASLKNRGIFDANEVARLLISDRRGAIDASYPLLATVCVELWCRQFLDGNR